MREIKFRAQVKYWIKINNKMYKKKDWYYFNLYDISIDGGLDFIDEKTISQYIGLKDKNGKEIYEGDITDIGIIEFQINLNWDGGGSIHSGFYFKTWKNEGELQYHDNTDECEIIDNIYENSELTKDNK